MIFKKNGPVSYVVRDQMSGKLKRVHAQHLNPTNVSKWYVPPNDPKIRKSRLAYAPSTHESDGDIDSDNDVANHIPHTTYKTQDTDSEDDLPLIHFLPKATTADNLSNATPLTVESTNHTTLPNTPNKPLPLSVDADHMSKRKASCLSSSDKNPLAQLKKTSPHNYTSTITSINVILGY